MASQRPPWFRFMRPAAAAPAPPQPAPTRPPLPAIVRPTIPIRPPPPPTQTQVQPPPPPASALVPLASPPRSSVTPPPQLAAASPRSPVVSPIPQPSPPKTLYVPPPHHTSPPPPPTTSLPSVPKNSPKTKTRSPFNSKPASPVANAAPTESPKTVKPMETTPIQSPKIKPSSHHPSPFTLPPPQIKTDVDCKKSVLVRETIDKPTKIITPNDHNNGVVPNGKREPTTKDKGTNKKLSDTEEQGMRMITLAGENKGAVMQLSPSHKKLYSSGNPQSLQNKNTKTWSYNGGQTSSETGEDGKSNNKDKTNRAMSMQPPTMSAILNSNVQGVNNSILYNMECRQNDPGVHISLTRKANGDRGRED